MSEIVGPLERIVFVLDSSESVADSGADAFRVTTRRGETTCFEIQMYPVAKRMEVAALTGVIDELLAELKKKMLRSSEQYQRFLAERRAYNLAVYGCEEPSPCRK